MRDGVRRQQHLCRPSNIIDNRNRKKRESGRSFLTIWTTVSHCCTASDSFGPSLITGARRYDQITPVLPAVTNSVQSVLDESHCLARHWRTSLTTSTSSRTLVTVCSDRVRQDTPRSASMSASEALLVRVCGTV